MPTFYELFQQRWEAVRAEYAGDVLQPGEEWPDAAVGWLRLKPIVESVEGLAHALTTEQCAQYPLGYAAYLLSILERSRIAAPLLAAHRERIDELPLASQDALARHLAAFYFICCEAEKQQ